MNYNGRKRQPQAALLVEPDLLYAVLVSMREAAVMTQAETAAAVPGLTINALSNYETGIRSPKWDTLQALAAVYGYDVTLVMEPAKQCP